MGYQESAAMSVLKQILKVKKGYRPTNGSAHAVGTWLLRRLMYENATNARHTTPALTPAATPTTAPMLIRD